MAICEEYGSERTSNSFGCRQKGGTQPTTESDKQEEGERGVITCNTKEREEENLNLLRDDDPDPNVWMRLRQPGKRERGSPERSLSEKRGGN